VRIVTPEQARRIAVRAQLLDGSARGVLSTVRRLGFLQLDPIAAVAPPQQLVLWSRLGAFDPSALDRLLWKERKLVEFNAFVYPIESLPLLRARMRQHRRTKRLKRDQWRHEFLRENAGFRRYVLRELERRGPLLSRELEDRSAERIDHRWYGNRYVGLMLQTLHVHGEIAVVGRSGGQRVWDLASRWYPETETVPLREAERVFTEQRFRALGVRLEKGEWRAHPDVSDAPVPDRVTLLSPFDRLIHDRARTTDLFDFEYILEMYKPAAKRRWGYFALPILHHDRLVGKLDAAADRKAGVLRVNAIHRDARFARAIAAAVDDEIEALAAWLGLAVER
jgi:uncharacterized protein YcaQ